MGKRRTRTEQTNRPIYASEIQGAAQATQNAFNQSLPMAQQTQANLMGASNDLFAGMQGENNAVLNANTFLNQQLTGDPTQNPYLDQMLDISNNRVMNQMQAQNRMRGITGGSDDTGIIARALAQNETGVRFDDYNQAMNRRMQAAGLAPMGTQVAAGLGQQGAMLPSQLAALNAAGVGGLLGQYQDVRGTQTQSGGLLEGILGGAFQLGSAAIMKCDIRLKENIERIGETPAGVPLYRFDYIDGAKGVVGPMAHEVAELQPDALGPVIDGFMTVNVGALQ